jgi:hypothetical protein
MTRAPVRTSFSHTNSTFIIQIIYRLVDGHCYEHKADTLFPGRTASAKQAYVKP